MPKPKTNSVIEKLRGSNSSYQSFTTQNGLNLQAMISEGSIEGKVMLNGVAFSAAHVLQAAEIIKLVAKSSAKVCLFHGPLDGGRFGCESCRTETVRAVLNDRDHGATTEEDEG